MPLVPPLTSARPSTGDAAIAMFKAAYGEHFVAGGVGTVVRIPQ